MLEYAPNNMLWEHDLGLALIHGRAAVDEGCVYTAELEVHCDIV